MLVPWLAEFHPVREGEEESDSYPVPPSPPLPPTKGERERERFFGAVVLVIKSPLRLKLLKSTILVAAVHAYTNTYMYTLTMYMRN